MRENVTSLRHAPNKPIGVYKNGKREPLRVLRGWRNGACLNLQRGARTADADDAFTGMNYLLPKDLLLLEGETLLRS